MEAVSPAAVRFAWTSPYGGMHIEKHARAAGMTDHYGRKIKCDDDLMRMLEAHGKPTLMMMGNFIVERDAILTRCRELGINTVHGEDGFFPHYPTCHADPLGFSWESSLALTPFSACSDGARLRAQAARYRWLEDHRQTELPAVIKPPFVLFPLQLIGDRVNVRGANHRSWVPLIEHARAALPDEVQLVVKRHPRGKPGEAESAAPDLPNTILCPGDAALPALLRACAGVIGANSTVLLEARLMFGRPTWAYERGWHSNHPGLIMPARTDMKRLPRLDRLDRADGLSGEHHADYADWFLDQLLQRQFGNDDARRRPQDFVAWLMRRTWSAWKQYGPEALAPDDPPQVFATRPSPIPACLAKDHLTAVVVSVNYDDMLAITLPPLVEACRRVVVVTEPGDPSAELTRSLGADVVESTRGTEGELPFDKGALINDGINVVEDGWVMLADADCVHSPELGDLDLSGFDRSTLYGLPMRFCKSEESWNDFAARVAEQGWCPPESWPWKRHNRPNGACQLFYRRAGYTHPEGLRVRVDIANVKTFARKQVLDHDELAPIHLGHFRKNHRLREFVAPSDRRARRFGLAPTGAAGSDLRYWMGRYERCGACRTVAHARCSEAAYARIVDRVEAEVAQLLPNLRCDQCLDFGCGLGRWLPLLSKIASVRWGCDIVDVPGRAGYDRFELLTSMAWPFASSSVDLVWCCQVLQHVSDKAMTVRLEQIAQTVRPGGTIVLIENVTEAEDRNYIRFRTEQDYLSALAPHFDARAVWSYDFEIGERHAVFVGTKS